MPTYAFRNKETDEVWEEFFQKNSEKEEYLSTNPHIEQTFLSFPATMEKIRMDSGSKHTSQFREVLQKTKKAHPHGTIDTGNITQV